MTVTRNTLDDILTAVAAGTLSLDSAKSQLQTARVGSFAHVDIDRQRRQGLPEAVFGANKTPEQVTAIVTALRDENQGALVTRASTKTLELLQNTFSTGVASTDAGTFRLGSGPLITGSIALITAGTSDLPVAREIEETLAFTGTESQTFCDVGVAGIHRILGAAPDIAKYDVIITVAGMDGALFSVVGGLFGAPIIAVPTSVGYGASLAGWSPLLAALTACSAGVSTVNIDNGFGGARAALRVLQCRAKA